MGKDEVIRHLCELVTLVGREVFKNALEHDCFCGQTPISSMFQTVHPEVIAFIDCAVMARIREKGGK